VVLTGAALLLVVVLWRFDTLETIATCGIHEHLFHLGLLVGCSSAGTLANK
jgi:hypothetical protein